MYYVWYSCMRVHGAEVLAGGVEGALLRGWLSGTLPENEKQAATSLSSLFPLTYRQINNAPLNIG